MFEKLKGKFAGLSNNTRLVIVLGIAFSLVVVTSLIFESDEPKKPGGSNPVDLKTVQQSNGLDPEQVAASQKALADRLETLQRSADANSTRGQTNDQGPQTNDLMRRIDMLESKLRTQETVEQLPPAPPGTPDKSKPAPDAPKSEPQKEEQPKLRVIKSENPIRQAESSAPKEVIAYLPPGSNFEAVLLNGMDANAGVNGDKAPTPSLLRIKTDAILPNLYNQDIRECFILVGGYGDISSERAMMRTDVMSCIDSQGKAFEGKAEGYVVGEDGKVGVRGRKVTRDGALMMKALAAGFISGVGNAFSPSPVNSLSLTNPSSNGSTQPYQYPSPDYVLGSGVGRGIQTAGQQLSNYYIKMAEKMYPVIEIDANRVVTVILIKGLEVRK